MQKHFYLYQRYSHPEASKAAAGAYDSGSGLCTKLNSYFEDNGLKNEVITQKFQEILPNFENTYLAIEAKQKEIIGVA